LVFPWDGDRSGSMGGGAREKIEAEQKRRKDGKPPVPVDWAEQSKC